MPRYSKTTTKLLKNHFMNEIQLKLRRRDIQTVILNVHLTNKARTFSKNFNDFTLERIFFD